MAATTRPMAQRFPAIWTEQKAYTLLANAVIPMGTAACNDAGVVKPATEALLQGGAFFLGMACDSYIETTGSNITLPMSFIRGCNVYFDTGKGGDAPVAANLGGPVYVSDNHTIKVTHAGGDQGGTLTDIVPGGGGFYVLI
jgi:hypothetical protein